MLRSFLPHLLNVNSFALGLTYSVTNDDLHSFLGGLSNLTHLHLHYYWVRQLHNETTVDVS